ncbi:circularly permuted type 2 ATP-grasp protein [Parvularcula sp. LCG005]|uniref:circularly permuted type 2 ATP-grasp protein n=1 Tax=Parvularcula sp. LCG005 TaxID=3078805 RepID=UPI00397B97E9
MITDGESRAPYARVSQWLDRTGHDKLSHHQALAKKLFRKAGITFQVYTEKGDPERLIPFDVIPRVFSSSEWRTIDNGVKQRANALNAFLRDIYGEQEIIKAGIIPRSLVENNEAFEPVMVGFKPPHGIYSHIIGTDIVRTGENDFFVLEDNCRVPSGVSYMLETRESMVRMFPELFAENRVLPVDDYSEALLRMMKSVAGPHAPANPRAVVLTPGHFNSAYYEHSFLADEMGIPLVEGADLMVEDQRVYVRTTEGRQQVDVIYRRLDDAFLDPLVFRKDSMLGVPGLMDAYLNGGVTLVNAPGAGVADDKAIYCFVPDMIKFYLGEEAILPNVETHRCADPDSLAYVLDNLDQLVVKEVHGSGGYGMLIGPRASREEIETFREKLKKHPSNYIAQPTLSLSTCPTLVEDGVAPRHVDLRPFCLTGNGVSHLSKGGLTRVALPEGSLVVNSSQGGGVKDTWVVDDDYGQSQIQRQSQ